METTEGYFYVKGALYEPGFFHARFSFWSQNRLLVLKIAIWNHIDKYAIKI